MHVRSCFIIQQDCFDDRAQITTDTETVVIKNGRNPRHIAGRRVTGNETLNQANGQERTNVRVVENIIQRHRQVLITRLAGRYCEAIQQCLGTVVMKRRIKLHWHSLVIVVAKGLRE